MTIEDYLYRKASMKKIPLNGTFELSPVCNFQCKMCYVRKSMDDIKKEGKCLRSWEEWLALGEKCRDAGMLHLLLTGGEPFLYPHFKELYIALSQMGFLISINSNGTLIDESVLEWLIQYPPHRINITLYGASKETYQRICGHASGYEKVLHGISILKKAGIKVILNASMIPENEMDLEKIFAFGKENDLLVRMATYMFPPIRREKEDTDSRFSSKEAADIFMRKLRCQIPKDQMKAHCSRCLECNLEEDSENWGAEGSTEGDAMWCRAGRSSFWISWDGNMTACGMVPFPIVVHPFEEDFKQCWETLTNATRAAKVLQGCSHCKDRKICKPCVAMIYSETGTTNEKAEYMCQLTAHTKEMMLSIVNEDEI